LGKLRIVTLRNAAGLREKLRAMAARQKVEYIESCKLMLNEEA